MYGNRIKAARLNANLSLKQLGELIGTSESTVCQYEHEKREPGLSTMKRLGEVLNVEWYTLFE